MFTQTLLANKFKNLLSIFILMGGLFISYSVIVQAQNLPAPDIAYPVEELGNCGNEADCKIYCDNPDNISACVAFAEKHNLLPKEEVVKAKAFIKAGRIGPGGCQGKNECEAFCNNTENLEVCLDFAEKNGFMEKNELKDARKFVKVVKEGARPPGDCRGKNECENYCNNPDHMEECLAFAEKAEMIPERELREAKKAMQAIKSGIKPPGDCRGKKECEAYCSEESHMEECLAFAEKAGFIPPDEAEQARKVMPLMRAGKTPGGCRGKGECEDYCADETHMEECANFAMSAGLMKPEEAETFRKTGGKGPGGCRSREQCEAFCDNPDNQEACFNFAKEHNLIPAEEVEKMKQGMEQMKQMMGPMKPMGPEGNRNQEMEKSMPPEISQCLKSTVGEEVLNKMQEGKMMPSRQLGEQMRNCFEKFRPVEEREGLPADRQGLPDNKYGMPINKQGMPGGFDEQMMQNEQMMPEEMMKSRAMPFDKNAPADRQGFQRPEKFPESGDQFNKERPGEMINEEIMGKMMLERKIPEGLPAGQAGMNIPEQYKNMMPQNMMPQQAPVDQTPQ